MAGEGNRMGACGNEVQEESAVVGMHAHMYTVRAGAGMSRGDKARTHKLFV